MDPENTVCPRCGRDFEFPRRFPIRADDYEFECVPRLLDCMHTCCHSCLEESSQIGSNGQHREVICPVCSTKKTVHGTFFLPLNGAVLKTILPNNGDVPLTCSRCRDDVESFSWCENCSAALCVFHHQDHKLSINTAKHHVETITELQHKNIPIIHRLPPIPCPHDPSRDSSVFCHECGYLVSAEVLMILIYIFYFLM